MNIHNTDHLTMLAASMNLTPEQVQHHLMNLGHALLLHTLKTSNMPGSSSAYALQLERQSQVLGQACHQAGVLSGGFPSSWLIDKRNMTVGTTGIENSIA